MTSTFVNDLRFNEQQTGDNSGSWGTVTNLNLELIGEALGFGTQQVFGSDANATTTVADGAADPARAMYFKVTSSGNLTATRTMTVAPNTVSRLMFIENATSGSQSIAVSQGSGANVTIPTGHTKVVYLDGAGSGAAVVDAFAALSVDDLLVDDDLTVTDDLVVGGDATFNGDTNTFASANSQDPLLIIKNTTNDANGSRMHFVKDKGAAGADGDDIGIIDFISDDAAQAQTTFARIIAEVSESANTDEAGKLSFFVAESDGTTTALAAGLVLEGEHATNGEVDVTIAAGTASTTTVAGDLVVTTDSTLGGDLVVSGSITTAAAVSGITMSEFADDAFGPNLTMQKSQNATVGSHTVVEDGDVIGSINFQGSDGDEFRTGAVIKAKVIAGVGNNDMPANLIFGTNAGGTGTTDNVIITAAGLVGVGTLAPEAEMHLNKATAGGRGGTLVLENSNGSATNNETQITFLTDSGASLAGTANARMKAINVNAGNGAADIAFTAWNGSAEGERLRIGNNGNLTINDGNLVVGTSGHGIDFSPYGNGPDDPDPITSNLLSDYEEGTFTPELRDATAGNAANKGANSGRYTKIGRIVNISFAITCSSKSGMTGGNGLSVSGLPYAINSQTAGGGEPHAQILSFINNLGSSDYAGSIILRPNNGTDACELKYTAAGAVTSQGSESLLVNNIANNTYLTGSATYETT